MSNTPVIGPKELYLLIRNNEEILFEGFVTGVTSFNEKGKFDVIPMHTNFISIIKDKVIAHQLDGKTLEIDIEHGIIKVMANQVNIFLGIDSLG